MTPWLDASSKAARSGDSMTSRTSVVVWLMALPRSVGFGHCQPTSIPVSSERVFRLGVGYWEGHLLTLLVPSGGAQGSFW